ncbi:hypothetical protein Salat_1141200 [Sesamum alatum]|uniref:Uncharacterized protein n=1 Tax=Sesamum alatum TaxID=300844 RepID=A0AAE1YEI4_9LAMI|nr:hypothetical protein Salat_1141200 [Sesamum alatum]
MVLRGSYDAVFLEQCRPELTLLRRRISLLTYEIMGKKSKSSNRKTRESEAYTEGLSHKSDYKFTIAVESFRCSQVVTVSRINNPIEGCCAGLCPFMAQKFASYACKQYNVPGLFVRYAELFISGRQYFPQTIDDGVEENTTVTPVVYEDEDESDDEGSQGSMEVEDGEEPQAYSDISDNDENSERSD